MTALAFAYTAGWLSPHRLTPTKLVTAVVGPNGPALGHRRNHARGICFTGVFDANGNASELSTAQVFARGEYPVTGRLNVAGSDPHMPFPMAPVRGFSTRIVSSNGQEWRGAAIDAPVFAAPTPQAFYAFLTAAGSKDPNAIKQYIAAHPEILAFLGWAKDHPRTESWAETRFNSLNSFVLVDASGARHVVRWSFVPQAQAVNLTPEELAKQPADFLETDIEQRVAKGPQRWELVLTVAEPGDPTADPTKAWPAERRTIDAGVLVLQRIEQEPDGPCRDINFDPSVLPAGMTTSDDPFPAARSAAYRSSFDARMGEASHYPHTAEGGK
ncbi:MAG TPA: catalase family peroxidase [Acidobacteriaceae bacterium]